MAAPHLWGGANFFEEYLAPVFSTAPETPAAAAEASVGAIELLQALLGAPVIAGLIGFFFAWWFYIRSPKTPEEACRSLAATYKLAQRKILRGRIVRRHHCPAPRLDFQTRFCGALWMRV